MTIACAEILAARQERGATAHGWTLGSSIGAMGGAIDVGPEIGWYHREYSYAAVSLGTGLRWRTTGGRDLTIELRRQLNSGGAFDEPALGMKPVTAGWSFGL